MIAGSFVPCEVHIFDRLRRRGTDLVNDPLNEPETHDARRNRVVQKDTVVVRKKKGRPYAASFTRRYS